MCISPSEIYHDRGHCIEKVPVPCKKCWRCKENRVNDYVGRGLAEVAYSDWALFVTFTYRDQTDLSDKHLTIKHFQNAIRKLQRRTTRIRYLACGEYGSRKGRAHFHAILYGKGAPLRIKETRRAKEGIEWPLEERMWDTCWPHGHMWVEEGESPRAQRYVAKYVVDDKDTDDPQKHQWFSMSKKPALGHEWFKEKAQYHIDRGLMPTSFEYMPPGGIKKHNYLMTGATKRDYLKMICDGLGVDDKLVAKQSCEWVQKGVEKVRRYENELRVTENFSVDRIADDMAREQRLLQSEYALRWVHHFLRKQHRIKELRERHKNGTQKQSAAGHAEAKARRKATAEAYKAEHGVSIYTADAIARGNLASPAKGCFHGEKSASETGKGRSHRLFKARKTEKSISGGQGQSAKTFAGQGP